MTLTLCIWKRYIKWVFKIYKRYHEYSCQNRCKLFCKYNNRVAGVLVQYVKCLPLKHKDLDMVPKTHIKKTPPPHTERQWQLRMFCGLPTNTPTFYSNWCSGRRLSSQHLRCWARRTKISSLLNTVSKIKAKSIACSSSFCLLSVYYSVSCAVTGNDRNITPATSSNICWLT